MQNLFESRIDLSEANPQFSADEWQAYRSSVERADRILAEEVGVLRVLPDRLTAVWRQGPFPDGRVELELDIRATRAISQLSANELGSESKLRSQIRRELWFVITAVAMNNHRQLEALADELEEDLKHQLAATGG